MRQWITGGTTIESTKGDARSSDYSSIAQKPFIGIKVLSFSGLWAQMPYNAIPWSLKL